LRLHRQRQQLLIELKTKRHVDLRARTGANNDNGRRLDTGRRGRQRSCSPQWHSYLFAHVHTHQTTRKQRRAPTPTQTNKKECALVSCCQTTYL
jgi:hypothetical protein